MAELLEEPIWDDRVWVNVLAVPLMLTVFTSFVILTITESVWYLIFVLGSVLGFIPIHKLRKRAARRRFLKEKRRPSAQIQAPRV
jgi:hypothetical protein